MSSEFSNKTLESQEEKNIKVAFSIPVHKSPEAILDLIINIKHFVQEPIIILHLSQSFDWTSSYLTEGSFFKIVNTLPFVFVNPQRLQSGRFYNIFLIHVVNYNHLIQKNVIFDYFCMLSSRDYFVRHGIENYIRDYTCGILWEAEEHKKNWYFPQARQDQSLNAMLKDLSITRFVGGQVEGSFYEKSIYDQIARVIEKYHDANELETLKYQREEIYFPTLCQAFENIDQNCGKNIVYVAWDQEQVVTVKDIKHLVHSSHYFAIKRVPLNINHYIRRYVRDFDQNYRLTYEQLTGIKPQKSSIACIHIIDLYQQFYKSIIVYLKKAYASFKRRIAV